MEKRMRKVYHFEVLSKKNIVGLMDAGTISRDWWLRSKVQCKWGFCPKSWTLGWKKISAVVISAAVGAKNIKLLLPPLTCRKI